MTLWRASFECTYICLGYRGGLGGNSELINELIYERAMWIDREGGRSRCLLSG